MPESYALSWLILAAVAGFAIGILVLLALRAGWVRDAHHAGASSRDAELVALASQRDALNDRARALQLDHQRLQAEQATTEQRLQQVIASAAGHRAQAEQLSTQLADQRRIVDSTRTRLEALSSEHAELRATAAEQAKTAAAKLALLDQAELRLRDTFQNLAQQILDAKAERFHEQNAEQLGGVLDPLKLQLKEFREAVTQTHAAEQRERGMLAQEIRSLKDLNQKISEDAINLTRALKGDQRTQGAWGELVLERVLEASGLQSGREYETQASFSGDDGQRQRPDVIVHLPDDKDIIVDAKVSLVAWERSVASADDGERAIALREHVKSLRNHVDGLSGKRYDGIAGLRTLDFVLMFIPIEAAFIEAVRHDANLYSYALGKNVSLVSPSTLLATLRTVTHLWRIERRNINAMEIARRAGLLHDNFALLAGELESLGSQLDKAQRLQTSAMRRITDGGKGSVILQVKALADLGAPTNKSLPANLLSAAGSGDAANAESTHADAVGNAASDVALGEEITRNDVETTEGDATP